MHHIDIIVVQKMLVFPSSEDIVVLLTVPLLLHCEKHHLKIGSYGPLQYCSFFENVVYLCIHI